ncbi:Semaphorin-5B [Dissostichus eleginoides]|uniref:Semaphorin-5B n=1 Tax=Dissostichus eleginoides TaxID=100907 RepID=A0AAD9CLR3_DISEL|nr:Semaphorin-5B [Dissostichus eleginoides]
MTTTSQDPAPSLMAALLLFLLLLLLPTVSMQTPVDPTTPSLFDPLTQPECTKKEHPKVSIQALSPWISSFSRPGVRDFSQLTLDLTRNELIVGARNFLFRLDLSNMSLIQAPGRTPAMDISEQASVEERLRRQSVEKEREEKDNERREAGE